MSNVDQKTEKDSISLKEFILKIQDYFWEVWKFKWIVFLSVVIFSLLLAYRAYSTKPKYEATLTFMINENEGGAGINGVSAILGTFGFGGGGEGQNLDKILQLSRTRKIAQNALFEEVELEGNNQYLANHLINYKDTLGEWAQRPFYKFWRKPSKLLGYTFPHDSIEDFKKLDYLALKYIHKLIVGSDKSKGMVISSYNELSGIMNLTTNSKNPLISIEVTKLLFNALSDYYVTKSIEKQKFTYDLVKSKTDSIQSELSSNEYALATLRDTKRNMFQSRDKLKEERLKSKIQIGYMALGKALENLAIADFTLKNKTPFIQVIDEPVEPIKPIKTSLFKALIFGGILGALIAIGLIILRRIYNDVMRSS